MGHASEWDSSKRMRATLGWASVCTPAPFSAIGVHERYGGAWTASIPDSMRLPVIIHTMDDLDRQILALLVEDGRRTYDDIGRRVSLSAPSVKRRVDRLRSTGAIRGFTAVLDPAAMGWRTEALVGLFYAPGTLLDAVATALATVPEVV